MKEERNYITEDEVMAEIRKEAERNLRPGANLNLFPIIMKLKISKMSFINFLHKVLYQPIYIGENETGKYYLATPGGMSEQVLFTPGEMRMLDISQELWRREGCLTCIR